MNQFILGNNYLDDLDTQIAKSREYQQRLLQMKESNGTPVWDKIDNIISTLTPIQQSKLMNNKEYSSINNEIQSIVWKELVNIVKCNVEKNNKELLNKQLDILNKLKARIVEEDTMELNLFNEFKEYSKQHPDATYSEFLKTK